MTEEEKQLAEKRRDELEAIRTKAGGVLNPEDVVDFAKKKNTALHSAFTWDDGEAAAQYRLWQARQVIRVCVTIRDDVKGPPLRTYVSLMEDRGDTGYRLLTDVMTDEEMRAKLLEQALNELQNWQQRYRQLKALEPIFAAAAKVRKPRKAKRVAVGA